MKELLSLKTIVGLLSSAVITGSLLLGLNTATHNVPEHWVVAMNRIPQPVEVNLLGNLGLECEWLSSNPENRVAQCPNVLVTARRLKAMTATAAATAGDTAAQPAARSHPPSGKP
jgi:hypothetical protein